ncbi:immunoglobulin-like domain-containing protein (plasmid) [Enterococcus faecium]|uniref:immunoglobulin-like domain-containing protein n=1 Tax=Enterococcus faecium TaxID=1352 RepID=UPI0038D43379
MKFKKTLGTLLISVSILGTITPTNSIFAEEDCQAPTVQQNQQVVTIPDVNLKKALNNVLGQEENHEITADQLATIENLNLVNLGLTSIEGLQYCKNLKELWLGSGNPSYHLEYDSNPNQVTDLTPLKGLTKLNRLAVHGLPVTDFSPLKNLPLSPIFSWMGGFVKPSLTLHANNTFSCKLPEYIGMDGQVIDFSKAIENYKKDLKGGNYDKATQTITWPCETFYGSDYPFFAYYNKHFCGSNTKIANCYLSFGFHAQTGVILGDKALDLTFALFENKQPENGKLTSDITQETITNAREEIERLDDNYNKWACNIGKVQKKADLLEWIDKAQQLFNQQEPSNQTIVNIPDKQMAKEIRKVLKLKVDAEITQSDMEKLTKLSPWTNDLTGLEYAKNLSSLSINENGKNGKVNWPEFVKMPNLTALNGGYCQFENEDVVKIASASKKQINWIKLDRNHITDLTALNGKLSDTQPNFKNQTVTEKQYNVIGDTLTVKAKDIKNMDGSTPMITPNNGGVYDASTGTITWENLPDTAKELSYTWKGKAMDRADAFTGTVKVPVKVKNITLDKYVVGESDSITGKYDGIDVAFIQIEVNGEKKDVISSKDLVNGQFKYVVGKDLKPSDKVKVVFFNQNHQEIGQQNVVIYTEEVFNIKGCLNQSGNENLMLISFKNNKCTIKYNTPGYLTNFHYRFSNTYFSINITDSNNNVICDHAWKGTDVTHGSRLIGSYDVPNGSIITMYHAEGTCHRFGTSDDKDLKPVSGHTYKYRMEKGQLVFVSAE